MTIERAKQIMANYDLNFPEVNKKLFAYGEVAEAFDMAIASLEAWEKVQQEINDLFSKPAYYMPNYNAYEMFLEIIDKHLQEVENDKRRTGTIYL